MEVGVQTTGQSSRANSTSSIAFVNVDFIRKVVRDNTIPDISQAFTLKEMYKHNMIDNKIKMIY